MHRWRGTIGLLAALCLGVDAPGQGPAPKDGEAGFVPLFDGTSLEGWRRIGGKAEAWGVENGALVSRGEGGGWLASARPHADFVLRLEFRLTPREQLGRLPPRTRRQLAYLANRPGDPAPRRDPSPVQGHPALAVHRGHLPYRRPRAGASSPHRRVERDGDPGRRSSCRHHAQRREGRRRPPRCPPRARERAPGPEADRGHDRPSEP